MLRHLKAIFGKSWPVLTVHTLPRPGTAVSHLILAWNFMSCLGLCGASNYVPWIALKAPVIKVFVIT